MDTYMDYYTPLELQIHLEQFDTNFIAQCSIWSLIEVKILSKLWTKFLRIMQNLRNLRHIANWINFASTSMMERESTVEPVFLKDTDMPAGITPLTVIRAVTEVISPQPWGGAKVHAFVAHLLQNPTK